MSTPKKPASNKKKTTAKTSTTATSSAPKTGAMGLKKTAPKRKSAKA
jgi:hypothetical protein